MYYCYCMLKQLQKVKAHPHKAKSVVSFQQKQFFIISGDCSECHWAFKGVSRLNIFFRLMYLKKHVKKMFLFSYKSKYFEYLALHITCCTPCPNSTGQSKLRIFFIIFVSSYFFIFKIQSNQKAENTNKGH